MFAMFPVVGSMMAMMAVGISAEVTPNGGEK